MRPFTFEAVSTTRAAVRAAALARAYSAMQNPAQFLAGGTTLIDLMKLDVLRPTLVVDINALEGTELGRIETTERGLRLGALVRMADAADHAEVNRNFPALAQSLKLAASQQIRNMASLGGNVLQRTRCPYFRDAPMSNATNAIRDRVARRLTATTARTRYWERATCVSPVIRAILRRPCWHSTPSSTSPDRVATVPSPPPRSTASQAARRTSKRHWNPVKF